MVLKGVKWVKTAIQKINEETNYKMEKHYTSIKISKIKSIYILHIYYASNNIQKNTLGASSVKFSY